ncbi:hypothetical protein [Sphingobacterium sp.]|uniref:hypothetical protein n=1 Tax=Sphingobacterium sp. TaxID=341027 RepID=UPI0028AE2F27|nr:hypothetical protein [Sphingobacterium sp.]
MNTQPNATTQWLHFSNTSIKITSGTIEEYRPIETDSKDTVIQHDFKLEREPFTVFTDKLTGKPNIRIHRTDDIFLNFLIQASRIYWREELGLRIQTLSRAEQEDYSTRHKFNIEGPLLTDHEIADQKTNLINKLYTIGYMMHHYKDPQKPWSVLATPHNVPAPSELVGGGGQSIVFNQALQCVTKGRFYINGRNPNFDKSLFLFDGIKDTDQYVLIDDAHAHFNLTGMFEMMTGNLKIYQKFKSPIVVPFSESPKLCVTTGYRNNNLDPSVARRILHTTFSDYYHGDFEGSAFERSYKPVDDFGKILFEDFSTKEWNSFFNTMIYALRFYLGSTIKHNPSNPKP